MSEPKASRSSLVNHTVPPFYACYLLKSVKTPRTLSTYVGSTPHPPRRIRQHNGELTQGAHKTKRGRPWFMTMIVHGFPSKLAALQFEWAWQHPERSRLLRKPDGTTAETRPMFPHNSLSNRLRTKIAVVRTMINTAPYSSWPLHVKLFHPDARLEWETFERDMPLGFTVSVELEGVDGKSGRKGSGRTGPIDVLDAALTSAQVSKHRHLQTTTPNKSCSICNEFIDVSSADPLDYSICPSDSCTSTNHLLCLSSHFLSASSSTETSSLSLIPRGGPCPICNTYHLWGDIVRGCYRRRKGGIIREEDVVREEDSEAEHMYNEGSDGTSSDEGVQLLPKITAWKPVKQSENWATAIKGKSKVSSTKKRRSVSQDEDAELFEFPDDILDDVSDGSSVNGSTILPARIKNTKTAIRQKSVTVDRGRKASTASSHVESGKVVEFDSHIFRAESSNKETRPRSTRVESVSQPGAKLISRPVRPMTTDSEHELEAFLFPSSSTTKISKAKLDGNSSKDLTSKPRKKIMNAVDRDAKKVQDQGPYREPLPSIPSPPEAHKRKTLKGKEKGRARAPEIDLAFEESDSTILSLGLPPVSTRVKPVLGLTTSSVAPSFFGDGMLPSTNGPRVGAIAPRRRMAPSAATKRKPTKRGTTAKGTDAEDLEEIILPDLGDDSDDS